MILVIQPQTEEWMNAHTCVWSLFILVTLGQWAVGTSLFHFHSVAVGTAGGAASRHTGMLLHTQVNRPAKTAQSGFVGVDWGCLDCTCEGRRWARYRWGGRRYREPSVNISDKNGLPPFTLELGNIQSHLGANGHLLWVYYYESKCFREKTPRHM